jgi:hypothetical protein
MYAWLYIHFLQFVLQPWFDTCLWFLLQQQAQFGHPSVGCLLLYGVGIVRGFGACFISPLSSFTE